MVRTDSSPPVSTTQQGRERAQEAAPGEQVNAHAAIADPAPPAYQAEALRGQLCDDINRRFWRARLRIMRAFEGRKEQVERDFAKLSPEQFLAKYDGWRFL
jgi:hypothetical protein